MVRQTPQKGAAVARRKRRDHSGDADQKRPLKIYGWDNCDDELQHQLEMQGQKNGSPVDYRPASSKYQPMPPPSGCSAMSTVSAVGTTSVASATRAVGAMRKSGHIGCGGRSGYSACMGCNNCCECNEYSAQQAWRVR